MKERPILFSAPMVRALIDGSKTQTRRVMNGPWDVCNGEPIYRCGPDGHGFRADKLPPYGQPGDRLWVRETWQYADWTEDGFPWIGYAADASKHIAHAVVNDSDGWGERLQDIWAELSHPDNYNIDNRAADRRWRPSIHMPRWACRIQLEVTGVRVERLNDISAADAEAEGVKPDEVRQMWLFGASVDERAATYRRAAVRPYQDLWEDINGAGSWAANPFVWVIEFKRVRPTHV